MFLWIKVLHAIAVISWMAGMLYLPRLFVYHAQQPAGSDAGATFITMEGKLMKIIMRPSALIVLLTGLHMMFTPGVVDWSMGWMKVKLVAAVCLFAAHGAMEGWTRKFATGTNTKSPRFFRIVNEIPAVIMVIIVAMVIAKPF